MPYPSVFEASTTQTALERLSKLTPETKPVWGKMNASQMLAHLNVAYDICYGKLPVKNGAFAKFMLKLFVKGMVTTDKKPYPKNGRTADEFVISGERDFEREKSKLIEYIKETEKNGVAYFEDKESVSFGKMSAKEWSVQFYKHMDHHFQQFGI